MGRRRDQNVKRILLLLLSLALAAPAAAQLKLGGGADNLLEPEKAFRFSARALDASSVEVTFAIADGYYMYRERFKFTADGNPAVRLGAPEFPRGLAHKDEFFGETQVYRKNVRIRLPVEGEGRFDLKVISQGVNASSSPNRKKPPSRSAKLPSNRRWMSRSLAKIEYLGTGSTHGGAWLPLGRSSAPAAASW